VRVRTLLLDADGVLQRPPADWRARVAAFVGGAGDVDEFIEEVFRAEDACLTGHEDFAAAIARVLAARRIGASVAEALALWATIEPDGDLLAEVRSLRAAGVSCHLATNQQPHRARRMSHDLGYAELFEREFYSCHLGVKKPDPAYFRAVLGVLDRPAHEILFLDDCETNVAAARDVGLRAARFELDRGVPGLRRALAAFGIRGDTETNGG